MLMLGRTWNMNEVEYKSIQPDFNGDYIFRCKCSATYNVSDFLSDTGYDKVDFTCVMCSKRILIKMEKN